MHSVHSPKQGKVALQPLSAGVAFLLGLPYGGTEQEGRPATPWVDRVAVPAAVT